MFLVSIRTNGPIAGPVPLTHRKIKRRSTRLLVLHLGELGVDDVLVGLARAARGSGTAAGRLLLAATLRRLLLLGAHLLAKLLRRLGECLPFRLDLVLVIGLEHALGILDRRLDLLLLAGVDLVAVLLERLPYRVYQRFRLVPCVHQLERLLVVGGVRLGV